MTQRAFVIRPFNDKIDKTGRSVDFEAIHTHLIAPAMAKAGLVGGPAGQIIEAGNIREDMFALILEADLVIADITIHNANVFYELGIRHALRRRRTVLIRGRPSADTIPFDNLTDRYMPYDLDAPGQSVEQLRKVLEATLASDGTDSPIFKMLPTLPEVDPAKVQVLPRDLTEEVERARAAKAKGWLRLLAREVEGRRFQWPALRLIGRAQWKLNDAKGAIGTFRQLLDADPDDLDANDALANLYERDYRVERREELLTLSDQALKRVLGNTKASANQKSEALGQAGRNAKTRWRLTFQSETDPARRLSLATNSLLLDSYDAYRDAYVGNMNHFWSGLAALQMGEIALSLSGSDHWPTMFASDREAQRRREEMTAQCGALRSAVQMAVDGARVRAVAGSDDRLWADISRADLLFLSDEGDPRIRAVYKTAIPPDPWAVEAVKGQLTLFASLGYKAELARSIIDAFPATQEATKPSIVIVAGHRIDEPARAGPRFPASAVADVAAALKRKLGARQAQPGRILVLASALPGTDIIAHETCRDLGIASTICLPMPVDDYGAQIFGDYDDWRTRFQALIQADIPRYQLGDGPQLPKWLSGRTDQWERGNRWVLDLALSADAPSVTLIAVWDGEKTGDASGGTAHMLQIARDAGSIGIDHIRLKDGAVVQQA